MTMNEFPPLNICKPSHEVKLTRENEPTRTITVNAANSYQAIVNVLNTVFGDDRDAELPAMIIKCERIK